MKSRDLHLKSNEKVQNYPQDKHVHINDDDNEFRRKKNRTDIENSCEQIQQSHVHLFH